MEISEVIKAVEEVERRLRNGEFGLESVGELESLANVCQDLIEEIDKVI